MTIAPTRTTETTPASYGPEFSHAFTSFVATLELLRDLRDGRLSAEEVFAITSGESVLVSEVIRLINDRVNVLGDERAALLKASNELVAGTPYAGKPISAAVDLAIGESVPECISKEDSALVAAKTKMRVLGDIEKRNDEAAIQFGETYLGTVPSYHAQSVLRTVIGGELVVANSATSNHLRQSLVALHEAMLVDDINTNASHVVPAFQALIANQLPGVATPPIGMHEVRNLLALRPTPSAGRPTENIAIARELL